MEILVEYVPAAAAARLTFSADIPQTVITNVLGLCRQADPQLTYENRSATMSWGLGLIPIIEIGRLRAEYGFRMRAIGEAENRLNRFQRERRAVEQTRAGTLTNLMSDERLLEILRERGWDFGKRVLRPNQVRDVLRLVNISNGANFSVPGAGKTTMTLAVHLAGNPENTHLMVVCPKNAFQAWDDVISDCLVDHGSASEPLRRLSGSDYNIRQLLFSGHRRFSINYDLLINRQRVFMDYLAAYPVHLVLDESHRIKADSSLRSRMLTAAAHLPIRRDILSGTPVPNSSDDLGPQLDFLWPGSDLAGRIHTGEEPRDVLRNLYVRTTKDELGLPPVNRSFIPVSMGQAQFALYGAVRDRTIQQILNLRPGDTRQMHQAKRSVLRLLQASTNPVAAAQAMLAKAEVLERDRVVSLLQAVLAEGDSNKMLAACQRARDLSDNGRKVVIWTSFVATITRMTELLSDLGATCIHGSVSSGDEEDDSTREGRIRRFHQDDSCRVLIANPAACSEGISLHHACHEAIYLDRTYNAAHYLQSLDRIHRLGLADDTITNVSILQSITPNGIASVDYAVATGLLRKLRIMEQILDDNDIRRIRLDEEENVDSEVFDRDRDLEDIRELLEILQNRPSAAEFNDGNMA